MKYYLIAGEASGDLHAGNLIEGLKKQDPKAQFRGFGGDKMATAGASITRHLNQMNFMGVWEVAMNMRNIRQNFEVCRNDLLNFKPDVLILVDYAGFNLRMAKFAREKGIRTYYYISPKIWAWKKSRIKKIKAYVDEMFVILPFEEDFYKRNNYTVRYVGNPLVDAVRGYQDKNPKTDEFLTKSQLDPDMPIFALLAGSRKQEVDRCLPEMVKAIEGLCCYQFVLAGAPTIAPEYYAPFIEGSKVKMVYDQTYALLQHAQGAIVTSGTATLETALFHVPQVVIYKTSPITYFIGRPFIHVTFISLVNLIMGKQVVKEFIQFNLAKRTKTEVDQFLFDDNYRQQMLSNYAELTERMGEPGVSDRAAKEMYECLMKK